MPQHSEIPVPRVCSSVRSRPGAGGLLPGPVQGVASGPFVPHGAVEVTAGHDGQQAAESVGGAEVSQGEGQARQRDTVPGRPCREGAGGLGEEVGEFSDPRVLGDVRAPPRRGVGQGPGQSGARGADACGEVLSAHAVIVTERPPTGGRVAGIGRWMAHLPPVAFPTRLRGGLPLGGPVRDLHNDHVTNERDPSNTAPDTAVATGLSVGVGLGVVLGLLVFDNIGLGLALGASLGVAAASVVAARRPRRDDAPEGPGDAAH